MKAEIMFSETASRVTKHTPAHLNERIQAPPKAHLISHASNPEAVAMEVPRVFGWLCVDGSGDREDRTA